MKLRIHSDLHLEFFRNTPVEELVDQFIPELETDQDSVLVLAGDISARISQLAEFLYLVSARFRKVLFVAGNHEYYQNDFETWGDRLFDEFELGLPENLVIAEEKVVVEKIDDVVFLMTTLWGDGGLIPSDKFAVSDGLNDFHVIKNFDINKMMSMNRLAKEDLREKIREVSQELSVRRIVVVTHHLPVRAVVNPRFIPKHGDGINGGFVGGCDEIFNDPTCHVDYWIHGHTHDFTDARVGDTCVLANPKGYQNENPGDYKNLILELDTDTWSC